MRSLARLFVVSLMTLTWGAGFFHTNLEAAGWLFDHEHHHPAYHDLAHDHAHAHTAGDGDDHEPLWAQFIAPTSLLIVAALTSLGLAAAFVFGLPWAATWGALLRLVLSAQAGPRWRSRGQHTRDPIWQFARRCAPDKAAPPVLA